MLRVRRRGGCLVIYGLVASFKVEKRKVYVGDVWFWVSPLSFSLSLSLSLSLFSLSLRVGILVCWCRLPSFYLALQSWNLSFKAFFVFRSDQIGFSLFFYREGHGLAEKLLLIIFIFWQISWTFCSSLILCAEDPFAISKKVSAPKTSGECSCGS